MFTTSINDAGRVIVTMPEITEDTAQNFTVSVKNENDWEESHNYIILKRFIFILYYWNIFY